MNVVRIASPLVLVVALVGGCAHVDTEPQMYYFSHSLLNFERQPLYPRKFEVPPPLEVDRDTAPVVAVRKQPAGRTVAKAGSHARRAPAGAQSPLAIQRDPETAPDMVAVASERGPLADPMPLAMITPPTVDADSAPDEPSEVAATRLAPEAPTGVRAEVLEGALRVVGIKDDFDGASFIAHVLKVSGVEHPVDYGDVYLRDLYKHLKAKGLTYDGESPLPGDLVFFHNSADRNGDGRNNDWYSLCGVIKDVDEGGSVTFIAVVRGEVQELVMNLGRPEVRRDERSNTYLNSFLRSKNLSDPEYTQYLAGELYAGFASVSLP